MYGHSATTSVPRHIPDFQASFQKVLCKNNNSAKQNSGYNSAAIQLTR